MGRHKGFKHTDITKQRIGKAVKRNHPYKDKALSTEHKKAISDGMRRKSS